MSRFRRKSGSLLRDRARLESLILISRNLRMNWSRWRTSMKHLRRSWRSHLRVSRAMPIWSLGSTSSSMKNSLLPQVDCTPILEELERQSLQLHRWLLDPSSSQAFQPLTRWDLISCSRALCQWINQCKVQPGVFNQTILLIHHSNLQKLTILLRQWIRLITKMTLNQSDSNLLKWPQA